MAESLKSQTLKGTKWSAIESLSLQIVQFLVMLIMARLLTPTDYGTIGLLTVFTAIAQSIVESGFSQALVRKQNRTDVDCCTVFYFNNVVSVILYAVCYIIAPWVADFYHTPVICSVMRVLSLVFVFNGVSIVHRAILTAAVDFKSIAKATVIASLLSGVFGVISAYFGLNVWALVIQQLSNALIISICLWSQSSWRPAWKYSWHSFKDMFGFGSKFMLSGILNTAYNNISSIIIGKIFTAETLGFYSRAQHFSTVPSSTLSGIVSKVTYPVMCTIQEDNEKLPNIYRHLIKLSAFVVFPLMILMSAVAEPMVLVLVGEKWRFSGHILTIIGFSMMWQPIHLLNLNLLAVKGRSDLFLRLEIIKKTIGILIICATIPFGIIVFVYAQIVSSLISLFINTHYTSKLINVGFTTQMKDVMPTTIISFFMFALVKMFVFSLDNIYVQFIGGCILGLCFFIVTCKIIKSQELEEIIDIIKDKFIYK